jgi:hypothetical protein
MRELLSTNTKLLKPVSGGRYLVRGLSLAPANHSGYEVCPMRGVCADACVLWFAGRTVTRSVRAAAIERTRLWFEDRPGFIAKLCDEIMRGGIKAKKEGARLAVRLNTASDIPFERIAPAIFEVIADAGGIAYDYTKYPADNRHTLPGIYHLTHSVSERTTYGDVKSVVERGRNLAIVIDAPYNASGRYRKYGFIPERVRFTAHNALTGHPPIELETVDGDAIGDVRIPATDGRGRAVILRGKGGRVRVAEAVADGFVRGIRKEWRGEWSGGYAETLPVDNSMRRPGVLDCVVAA